MADAIKILLVDDHAMFRAGIKALIEAEERLEVVGEASSGDEGVDKVRELKPDIVIMDLSMPGSNGLEATRRIAALELNTSVLVLTVHAEEDRRRAEYIRARARLEGLVDSNHKTFTEFGSMLPPEQQKEARQCLEDARKALESGSASECTEALEKIAEMGRILSEVILYDPGSFSAEKTEAE